MAAHSKVFFQGPADQGYGYLVEVSGGKATVYDFATEEEWDLDTARENLKGMADVDVWVQKTVGEAMSQQ